MEYSDLKPREVFRYFREISEIPHGSGNTKKITNYCIEFAERHKLRVYSDEIGNVVIYKPGSGANAGSEPIILQGHLDMVCEKTIDCTLDMEKDGLKLMTDGEYVWADKTTLGGDDGIAVAYMLALLSSDDIDHPPIEALFTVDEETGMTGAKALDASVLKGRRLINIDSEEEGFLTVSCAGGVRARVDIPLTYERDESVSRAYRISISGLQGGHSGVDIIRFRKNAVVLMGEILNAIAENDIDIRISELSGGGKDNAIACSASCVICVKAENEAKLCGIAEKYISAVKSEYGEGKLCISVDSINAERALDKVSTQKVISYLMHCPDGVQSMNTEIAGMPQSSLNMGVAEIKENRLKTVHLIRSNSSWGKQEVIYRLGSFVRAMGGEMSLDSDYPSWEYKKTSPLRDTMAEVYKTINGCEPEILSMHAGLECGILADKIDGADMVSFGPTLENVHTTEEKMSVGSVRRSWEYLILVLKKL